jgi:hypothetical protein
MKIKIQVIGVDKYNGKHGVGHTLCCFDQDTDTRLNNSFDYMVSELDRDTFGDPEQLKNQVIEVGLTELVSGFGNRIRTRGKILSVPKKG